MSTLRELYISLKDSHPETKIGFGKFAQFRPKHCVLAGFSGLLTVCVCIYHQNVKLILEGVDVPKPTSEKVNDYKDCISLIVCEESSNECFLTPEPIPALSRYGDPGKLLLESLHQKGIDQVHFQSWLSIDHCKLETRVTSAGEFVEEFVKLILKSKTHAFTEEQQASFSQWLKDNLKKGGFLILMNFAENYALLIQDAVQFIHYNNEQCNIVTVVIYHIKDPKAWSSYLIIWCMIQLLSIAFKGNLSII
ncbi:hypothetical protein QAD02_005032 [Eretmocerus hayati]|uniref:Uncharacterized protein n=1 Tax=Eretmocerus hayati TaxID=131215 RepID=A0ACC2NW45_9HYME|nr:hypothetical protein QAD02_005032 [Eretmocerus hayati]